MARCITLLAVGAVALGSCGDGDDSAPVAGSTPTTTAAPAHGGASTSAAEQGGTGGAAGDGETETGTQPQPGSGAGAHNAVIAAAAVLTRKGTAQQACGDFVTEEFVRTAYGGEQNCIVSRRPAGLAREILVSGGDEDSTGLVVVPEGGTYDGVEVEVRLIEEKGSFRVDRLEADVPAGP